MAGEGGYGYDAGYGGGGYAEEPAYDASSYEDYEAPVYEEPSYAGDGGAVGGTYVVQSGDTLAGIAAELGTTVGDLAATNGIANPNVISVGQVIEY